MLFCIRLWNLRYSYICYNSMQNTEEARIILKYYNNVSIGLLNKEWFLAIHSQVGYKTFNIFFIVFITLQILFHSNSFYYGTNLKDKQTLL